MDANQLFDIGAALIIVVLGIVGFLKGFVSAVMSIAGLFCGSYYAWKLSGEGTAVFLKFFPNIDASIANIVSMAIIFLGVALVVSIISRLLCFFINIARLSTFNHIAGMLIGLASGFVFIIIVYVVITRFAPEFGHDWMRLSIFMNLAEISWPNVFDFLTSCGIDIVKLIPKTL
ncbi:MAG: CvpA family protein [Synergistaceae bacterium]|nr:CvpA family protein [Synergistaceae bacterium]